MPIKSQNYTIRINLIYTITYSIINIYISNVLKFQKVKFIFILSVITYKL